MLAIQYFGLFLNYRAGFVEQVLDYAGKEQREREVLAAMDSLRPPDKLPYTDDRFREKVDSLRSWFRPCRE